MRLSILLLTNCGGGANLALSCRVTSATRSLCPSVLRAFMTRTTAASIRCRRSSSTGAGTAPAAAASPIPGAPGLASPGRTVSFMDTRGTLTRLSRDEKAPLNVKESSGAMNFPREALRRIRCLGVHRLMRCRSSSPSGTPDPSRISWSVSVSLPLNSASRHIWYVDTQRSCFLPPSKVARTSAVPADVCHASFLPVCFWR
mmetsp:Transcript_18381/g.36587  ORF Transcript_18381/g.36587 Transcript_18381/m.36587 type:complete len:201 (+) Transcript_18381:140-742(+)